MDIVEFARENGVFDPYFPDNPQYVGDNVTEFNDITYHELMFLDGFGYVDTYYFGVNNVSHEIVPFQSGDKSMLGGFNPDEMRKKLAMVDKAGRKTKAARKSRTA